MHGQEVQELVHEAVLPADHVAVGPVVLPVRVVGLRDEHRAEALRVVARRRAAEVHLQLVHALLVEDDRALRAVDLPAHLVLAPEREARRLVRADGAVLELDGGLERVVDVDRAPGPLVDERLAAGRSPPSGSPTR